MNADLPAPGDAPLASARREELAGGLRAIGARIAAACEQVGREVGEITLVVVTKTFPASDVVLLADLGVRDIGENRDQEAGPKVAQVRAAGRTVTAHFIGQLQTNKAGHVAQYADVVHAVDRPKLVRALDAAAERTGRALTALVQVSLDEAPVGSTGNRPRAGVAPEAAPQIADLLAGSEHLELAGVMAVAPLGGDPDIAFARLWHVAQRIRADHPRAAWISAGMSGDLEAAVRHGATHLRVGSAILGSRPALR